MPTTRSSLSSSMTLRSSRCASVSPGRSGSLCSESSAARDASVLTAAPGGPVRGPAVTSAALS